MGKVKKNDFVPYELVSPGFEAVYTGERDISKIDQSDINLSYTQDQEGNVFMKYSTWGFCHQKEEDWNAEIRHINRMQENLGVLDDDTRRIRAQIASLQCCDNGVPVTIDEILNAIGTGKLSEPAFHPGCWLSMGNRTTQPYHVESMRVIENVIKGYLDNQKKEHFISEYPNADGFITHTYTWLGHPDDLSELQKLMLERILLPFEFFTKRNKDHKAVNANCFEEGGRGVEIDARISDLAGLPKIHPDWTKDFKKNREMISDPEKRRLYETCGAIAHGTRGLSDCHHSAFRWIENWIYAIGTGKWGIPSRKSGTERERLGRLLFGYALGIDNWLLERPMQFLLLDLGHVDFGFDPKNEILRVFAYLSEKTPVKEWLAACMWYKFVLEPPASLYKWGSWHNELLKKVKAKAISVRKWMDSQLKNSIENR